MTTLAEKVGGRDRVIGGPFGSKLTQKDYVPIGVPVIRGSNMEQSGRYIGGDFAFVSSEKVEKDLKANLAHPGDIVVTQRGTLGQVSMIADEGPHEAYVVSQSQMAISVDEAVADPLFVYYFLKSDVFNNYVERSTIQTGVPHINLTLLREAPVQWPELGVQKSVSFALGSLDDKIEVNRRMNETLEAMAQAIFRDWFVDFGPTRRKQEGATDPVNIMGGVTQNAEDAARLADLFPDALGNNGLPHGWEEKPIGEVAEIVGGATPSTKTPAFWEGGTHNWATPKDLSKMDGLYLSDTDRKITDAGVGKISSGLSPVGTVLLSSRAPIGYLAIASEPTAVNQGFIAIRPTDVLPTVYALMWCREYMDLIKKNANGSTFQEISKRNFRPLAVTMPGSDLMAAFSEITDPIMSRVKLSEEECTTLAETRDLLLPRLMTGEITLKDAAALAEAAE